jgi:DNA-binding XRE family transcriptional regulator
MTTPPLNGLRARREFAKLTQAELAQVIEVSQAHYDKIEKGRTRCDVHRAFKLASRLKCTIEELL